MDSTLPSSSCIPSAESIKTCDSAVLPLPAFPQASEKCKGFLFNTQLRAGERAQWLKHSLHKCKNVSLNPRNPWNSQMRWRVTVVPVPCRERGGRQKTPWKLKGRQAGCAQQWTVRAGEPSVHSSGLSGPASLVCTAVGCQGWRACCQGQRAWCAPHCQGRQAWCAQQCTVRTRSRNGFV